MQILEELVELYPAGVIQDTAYRPDGGEHDRRDEPGAQVLVAVLLLTVGQRVRYRHLHQVHQGPAGRKNRSHVRQMMDE